MKWREATGLDIYEGYGQTETVSSVQRVSKGLTKGCEVYTAVATSIGSDIHLVFAKLAGPWHQMTANIISVSHYQHRGKCELVLAR